jgi:hypothetical protein
MMVALVQDSVTAKAIGNAFWAYLSEKATDFSKDVVDYWEAVSSLL